MLLVCYPYVTRMYVWCFSHDRAEHWSVKNYLLTPPIRRRIRNLLCLPERQGSAKAFFGKKLFGIGPIVTELFLSPTNTKNTNVKFAYLLTFRQLNVLDKETLGFCFERNLKLYLNIRRAITKISTNCFSCTIDQQVSFGQINCSPPKQFW